MSTSAAGRGTVAAWHDSRDRPSAPHDTVTAADIVALRDMRRARQARRLGDTEWFDVAYRVYLFALVGCIAVVTASDAIDGLVDDDLTTVDLLARGPSIAGVVAALAFAVGLRNGSDGGPVSIESADVRHVLLSPVNRRRALLRPVIQRIRAVAFLPALSFGVVAQLVAREVEGSRAAWAASGAIFGVCVGVLYVGTALLAHELRCSGWFATLFGSGIVVWQGVAAWTTWQHSAGNGGTQVPGPFDLIGGVLFWGIRQGSVEAVAIVVVLAMAALGVVLAGRLRLEPLERRGQLVSQLRFAATVQDIRTVVLLRRQLRAESARQRPWFPVVMAPGDRAGSTARAHHRPIRTSTSAFAAVVRRGLVAMSRLPASRLVRMSALAAIAGVFASLVVTSTFLFALGLVGAVFLLGLEAIEPLAQEVDRPDLTESVPYDRGRLFVGHLAAPAVLLALAGLVGAAAATRDRTRPHRRRVRAGDPGRMGRCDRAHRVDGS